jgi:hypothetical protein
MRFLNYKNHSFLKDLFIFFSGLIVMMVFFELLWPASVLVYFNLNYAVFIWLLLGLMLLF